MAFSDLKQLNEHLATRSYIEGYVPSQADVGVYKAVGSAPDKATYPHAARWYAHIKSYEPEHGSLPGDAAASEKLFGGAGASAPAPDAEKEKEDDDDDDMFNSDEDDEEAERLKAERVAAYNARKAGKPKTVAKTIFPMTISPWSSDTDLGKMEQAIRSISMPGLTWLPATSKVALAYGICNLLINCLVEDDKVPVDVLRCKMMGREVPEEDEDDEYEYDEDEDEDEEDSADPTKPLDPKKYVKNVTVGTMQKAS